MAASKKGGRRPGAGRKPRVKGARANRSVTVKLTPAEFGELEDAAGDKLPGVYLRDLLLFHLARRKK